MHIIVKKSKSQQREQAYARVKAYQAQDKAFQKDIADSKRGGKRANAGYSEPGYNVGLGTYITDRQHFDREVKKLKSENPDIEVG